MTDETQNKLYQEHLSEMFGNEVIDHYSDEEIFRVLKRLIACLPNGGKLYKYRSISGDAFDNAYDALEKGYLWLPTADMLNDDEDCTLFYDPQSEVDALKKYVKTNADTIAKKIISQTPSIQPDAFKYASFAIDCFDQNTGRIKKKKALSLFVRHGYSREKSKEYIDKIQELMDDLIETEGPLVQGVVDEFLNFNKNNRQNSYIYSLSEDYDSNPMWAHYADSNRGFCIEYDFNKALELPSEVRRRLISTYKVIYKEEKEPFSFIGILDYILRGQQDKKEFQKINYELLTWLITKRSEWSYEKEWRIFLNNVPHRLDADIVSAIIIDDRIMETENARKLIGLCKVRGWRITVRTKNSIQTEHVYRTYEEWIKGRSQNA